MYCMGGAEGGVAWVAEEGVRSGDAHVGAGGMDPEPPEKAGAEGLITAGVVQAGIASCGGF